MSRNLLIVALLLGSAFAQAQTPTFNLTLTSANGGADTLFSWSYTGTISYTRTASGTVAESSYIPFFGVDAADVTSTNPGVKAFAGFDSPFSSGIVVTFASGNTGLAMTSTADGASTSLIGIYAIAPAGMIVFEADPNSLVFQSQGETVTLSGPTSGSLLSGYNFSNFNVGQWTTFQAQYPEYSFDTVLTIVGSAPIPEPSTYGLALGGLALVGAVMRRRKISK